MQVHDAAGIQGGTESVTATLCRYWCLLNSNNRYGHGGNGHGRNGRNGHGRNEHWTSDTLVLWYLKLEVSFTSWRYLSLVKHVSMTTTAGI